MLSLRPSLSPPPAYGRPRQRRFGIAAGLALSLALHALLLFGYRVGTPPARVAPRESLTVWVRTPPPPQRPAAMQPAPRTIEREARRPARQARTAEAPAKPAISQPITLPSPASERQADLRAEEAPKFDMEAARRTARQMANAPDPARAGLPVAQLDNKPLQTESKLARDIASGKRANCKDGIPGGLLAPLYLIMDKKDSGCKW